MMCRSTVSFAVLVFSIALCGCGSQSTQYPNQLKDADGNPILLDDIEAVVGQSSLSEEEQRAQLRELGIEDEKLITALLSL